MPLTVCKFGGTSLATRAQADKCLDIMLADRSRKYMVVSAPGARHKGDIKMTDLLIRAATEYKAAKRSAAADQVVARFKEMAPEDAELCGQLERKLLDRLADTGAAHYEEGLKAFGEYGSACVIHSMLKGRGLSAALADPADIGFVIAGSGHSARPDPKCYGPMGRKLKALAGLDMVVVPGFYGYDRQGQLITLPRGGSDTSGAAVARAVGAGVYENWTDENGLRRADPRVVPDAETIPEMTYDEARELTYMGFKLQDACFEPIKGADCALNVRNTNNPAHPGTRIVDAREVDPAERIVGVACQQSLVAIGMRKMYLDKEVGFGRRMFAVLEKLGLPYEHTLDGVDSAALVLDRKYLQAEGAFDQLVDRLRKACKPAAMITSDFALLSVAGLGLKDHLDVHARTFAALAREQVAIRMIDEGADDLSFFVGIDSDRAADAVRAVYREFFGQ